jgi:hypothetical protein
MIFIIHALGILKNFITFIIPEFANAYKMNMQDAYYYLEKYGGLDFIYEHWWTLHTDNEYYALKKQIFYSLRFFEYKIMYFNGL